MNDIQAYALHQQKHTEMIAEAEARRVTPRRSGTSRRLAARALHQLADRISPEPSRGHGHRPVPRVPTTV
ncbi:hypothetical protein [Streptosporangium sp. 'caverna']|uniref:hypothetical protein n=1 Tax=Streptosporangium sp. 'caverna' TaxID=2202249 RepID=UPI000D7DA816|nr:hypothetical protein [Streptosporangium sp. 'caverna']AWS45984.1 hypothetical protein DKM19_36475 [Streptosporangium sp. 'caverna']